MATKTKEKEPGTAVVNYEEEMRKEIAQNASRTQASTGDVIRVTQDKLFKVPGQADNAGPLTFVVVDFVSANYFYDKAFKDGEGGVPACFALGTEPTTLVPSKNSPDKQSDECKGCPNNEFGSNPNGRGGKACGNTRLLALMEDTEDRGAPTYILKVSATGCPAWDAYVNSLGTRFNKPSWGIVTDIYFDDKSKFPSLRFGNPVVARPEVIANAFARKAAARARLLQEPDVSGYEKPVKKGPKGK